ncbi:histidine phosphatase family protein [Candidatus Saccharibacteria bacterium]|nr:MAG: histidine phosphatase family protein [Candidatus Saccharibacteria bacterium]
MGRVLYIRHGQSQANLAGILAGGSNDSNLTDLGRQQARQAGRALKNNSINKIITSPLSRALETAQIIAAEIGYDVQRIELDPRLKEYELGVGQGQSLEGMTAEKIVSFPGAEKPAEFAKRVKSALYSAWEDSGTVVIVAHGGVSRLIDCLRIGKDPKWFYDMPNHGNATVVELDLTWLKDA